MTSQPLLRRIAPGRLARGHPIPNERKIGCARAKRSRIVGSASINTASIVAFFRLQKIPGCLRSFPPLPFHFFYSSFAGRRKIDRIGRPIQAERSFRPPGQGRVIPRTRLICECMFGYVLYDAALEPTTYVPAAAQPDPANSWSIQRIFSSCAANGFQPDIAVTRVF